MYLGTDLVKAKWLLKNYKLTARLKNKTWANPQIKKHKKNPWTMIRPQA
jgi:hypothetical protein